MTGGIPAPMAAIGGALALILIAAGCGKDTIPPEDPGCMVEPSSLDFGERLSFPGDPPDTIAVDLKVTSLVVINSTGGTSDLTGDVSYSLDTRADHPPRIALLPPGRDTHFVLPARTAETFHFQVVYDAATSPGVETGRFSFGTPCGDVPFTLDLTVAPEGRPDFIGEWGGEGSQTGRFDTPSALAVGPLHLLYVADQVNNRVQVLDRTGTVRQVWRTWYDPDTELGLTYFGLPGGIAVGPAGEVYVVDTEPDSRVPRITEFTSDGTFVKRWGPLPEGGSLFSNPFHLAVSPDGTIYSVDAGARLVRAFVLDDSEPGYHIAAQWGGSALFGIPYGIAVDGSGHVFVSDQARNRIHRFDGLGHEELSWGSSGDGIGQFHGPLGVAVDTAGAVYVADSGNHRVQKFAPDGTFLTRWGTWGSGTGEMRTVSDVEVDDRGIVYVLDQVRDTILRFQSAPGGP